MNSFNIQMKQIKGIKAFVPVTFLFPVFKVMWRHVVHVFHQQQLQIIHLYILYIISFFSFPPPKCSDWNKNHEWCVHWQQRTPVILNCSMGVCWTTVTLCSGLYLTQFKLTGQDETLRGLRGPIPLPPTPVISARVLVPCTVSVPGRTWWIYC